MATSMPMPMPMRRRTRPPATPWFQFHRHLSALRHLPETAQLRQASRGWEVAEPLSGPPGETAFAPTAAQKSLALQYACASGNLALTRSVVRLLNSCGPLPRVNAALLAAGGCLKIVAYLCTTCAPVDIRADGNLILRAACENGHLAVVRHLCGYYRLTRGDLRACNNHALRAASQNGHAEIVRYLVEVGGLGAADARAVDNQALRAASRNGHAEIVRYLGEEVGLGVADICTQVYADILCQALCAGDPDRHIAALAARGSGAAGRYLSDWRHSQQERIGQALAEL